MTKHRVVILKSAKKDLQEIRDCMISTFSRQAWLKTSDGLKEAMLTLENLLMAGSVPPEIEVLGLAHYRQIIADMNRIIYEVRMDIVYVHGVVDVRRDMTSYLTRRLLRPTDWA